MLLNAGLDAIDEVLARNAHAHALDAASEGSDEGLAGALQRGRIPRVVPADRLEHNRAVGDVAGERPDLVQRARKRDQPVSTDQPVCRLHADDSAERCGLTNTPARVRPQGDDRFSGRHRRCRAAAATPRYTIDIPRVSDRPECGVLVGGPHRELVEVRLANDDRARCAEPFHHVRIERGNVAVQDFRSRRRPHPGGRDVVLDRDRNTVERPQGSPGASPGIRGRSVLQCG